MEIYKTKGSAKAAIKRQGLHLMNYEIRRKHTDGCYPHFYCAIHEDVEEIRNRGFSAEFNPELAV